MLYCREALAVGDRLFRRRGKGGGGGGGGRR